MATDQFKPARNTWRRVNGKLQKVNSQPWAGDIVETTTENGPSQWSAELTQDNYQEQRGFDTQPASRQRTTPAITPAQRHAVSNAEGMSARDAVNAQENQKVVDAFQSARDRGIMVPSMPSANASKADRDQFLRLTENRVQNADGKGALAKRDAATAAKYGMTPDAFAALPEGKRNAFAISANIDQRLKDSGRVSPSEMAKLNPEQKAAAIEQNQAVTLKEGVKGKPRQPQGVVTAVDKPESIYKNGYGYGPKNSVERSKRDANNVPVRDANGKIVMESISTAPVFTDAGGGYKNIDGAYVTRGTVAKVSPPMSRMKKAEAAPVPTGKIPGTNTTSAASTGRGHVGTPLPTPQPTPLPVGSGNTALDWLNKKGVEASTGIQSAVQPTIDRLNKAGKAASEAAQATVQPVVDAFNSAGAAVSTKINDAATSVLPKFTATPQAVPEVAKTPEAPEAIPGYDPAKPAGHNDNIMARERAQRAASRKARGL